MLAPACGSTGFALAAPTVDATYTCAQGSTNSPYNVQARLAADNSTSKSVGLTSIDAVMVVVAIHGQWQQPVGTKYDAGDVSFSPTSVGAGTKATVTVTIPSACTNFQHQGTSENYGDYTIQLTVVTTAGTFHLTSQNRHRIVAP